MKKYNILFIIIAAAFGLSSCNDSRLDLRTNGSIEMSQVFSDRNRTRGYLNTCYNYIQDSSLLNVGSYTDDAQNSHDNTNGSAFNFWYTQGLTSTNFGKYNYDGDPWGNYFNGIQQCNVFIANIDGATGKISDQERVGWKAQAYALRAYYYLQLMKRYGRIPLVTSDLGLSHNYSGDSRASIGAITAQILSDCDAAIKTPDSDDFSYVPISDQWMMMTKAVAQDVRSEAITWAVSPLLSDGSYTMQQALDITADALAQLLSHGYSLWTTASEGNSAYATYFLYNPNDLRAKDKETIYGGFHTAVWSDCGLPVTVGMTSAGSCPTQDLVDAYDMANGQVAISGYSDKDHLKPVINAASGYDDANPYIGRDPRFYATVIYNGASMGAAQVNTNTGGNCAINNTSIKYTHTGYYMRKYASEKSNRNSNSDGYIRSMRLPEVYFNFAEIAYQIVGPDEKVQTSNLGLSARDAVDAVRSRAGMPNLPSGLSSSAFEARYRNERRVEYAMEADRYFCLRRWKLLGEKTKFVTGMKALATGESYTYQRFRFTDRASSSDKYLLYPINIEEVNKIMRLTGDDWQNAGW